jgi:osmotically-inducible protein OsmY
MKSDAEIREDVISELRWDPQVPDPDAIGVAVQDGAVTVTGYVPVYAGKLAADRAAARVYGVRAVADEIQVRLQGEPRDDSEIARAIAHVMEWNTQIPVGAVCARVESGLVRLEGKVGFDYQRREVERMVRHVRGVAALINDIEVTPQVSIDRVQAEIEASFTRVAMFDARHIRIEVSDHTAVLHGHVHSLAAAQAAATAAAAAPGVARVDSRLTVSP